MGCETKKKIQRGRDPNAEEMVRYLCHLEDCGEFACKCSGECLQQSSCLLVDRLCRHFPHSVANIAHFAGIEMMIYWFSRISIEILILKGAHSRVE